MSLAHLPRAGLLPTGTLPYVLCKAIPGVTGLLGIVVFIRLAGPSSYGVYSVCFAAAVFSCSLTTGWILQASLRFAGDRARPWYAIRRWSILASLLAAGLTTSVTTSFAFAQWQPLVVAAAGLVAIALAAQGLLVTRLQSELQPRRVVLTETLRAILQFAIPTTALVLFARSGLTLLLAMSSALALSIIPFRRKLLPPAHRFVASIDPRRRAAALRTWWSYGWPMSIWLSVATVLQYADRILIARWRGSAEAGTYAGIYDIVNGGLAVCLFPITMAAYPRISRLWNAGDRTSALTENTRALRAQLGIFIPVAALVFLLRGDLVRIALNGTSPGSVAIVMPVLLGAFSWQLALTTHKRLELERRTRVMLAFVLIAAFTNVVLNVVTIPTYGALAAAWTTFSSAAVYLLLCTLWRWRNPVPIATLRVVRQPLSAEKEVDVLAR